MSKSGSTSNKNTLFCSFCGKSQHEVKKLIAGPTVFICDECVELCMDIIKEEVRTTEGKGAKSSVPAPKEIFDVLNDYVIGQSSAKKILSSQRPVEPRSMNESSPWSSESCCAPLRTKTFREMDALEMLRDLSLRPNAITPAP